MFNVVHCIFEVTGQSIVVEYESTVGFQYEVQKQITKQHGLETKVFLKNIHTGRC